MKKSCLSTTHYQYVRLCFVTKRRKGGVTSSSSSSGECIVFVFCMWFICWFWRFRGGGKGSDEEHITYSGGKEIFDLLRCGWRERKWRKEKKIKIEIKWNIVKIVKYQKIVILVFYKILLNYNNVIIEIIK